MPHDSPDLIETERKRRVPDGVLDLPDRLSTFGYAAAAPVVEIDVYYSRPDVDFMQTIECLRVRRRDGFSEITYKPPSDSRTHQGGDVIAKTETNVLLADSDQAAHALLLLEAVGMRRLVTVVKTRTQYRHPTHNHAVVCLDEVAEAGIFIEIEVKSTYTMTAHSDAIRVLEDIEQQLQITTYPTVKRPYRDLVLTGG